MAGGKVAEENKKKIVSERRRYARIVPPKALKVKYSFIQCSEPKRSSGDALSKSLSCGGLFLELPYLEPAVVDELLRGEKKLSMEIELPNAAKSIKALGEVAWMEGKKNGERCFYGAGVSFIKIDENDRDEIINYIIDLYLQEKKSG